ERADVRRLLGEPLEAAAFTDAENLLERAELLGHLGRQGTDPYRAETGTALILSARAAPGLAQFKGSAPIRRPGGSNPGSAPVKYSPGFDPTALTTGSPRASRRAVPPVRRSPLPWRPRR